MAAMKENTRKVFEFLKTVDGEDYTAKDIAEALGLEKKVVDGCITAGLWRKKLAERVEKEITLEDGSHSKAKFIYLTEKGRSFDPDAEDAQ